MASACALFLAAIAIPQSEPPGVRTIALDDLIGSLPPSECGWTRDEKQRSVPHPAVTELHRRLAEGLRMSDSQWERALLTAEVFRFRRVWPANVPFAISVQEPAWTSYAWPPEAGTRVRAVPTETNLKAIEGGELIHGGCGNFELSRRKLSEYQETGLLGVGKHRIPFDVHVESGFADGLQGFGRTSQTPMPPLLIWSGRIAIDVEIVPTLEEAIPSVDSPELEDVVRRSLCRFPPSDDGEEDGPSRIWVAFSAEGLDASKKLGETAMSLIVALYRNDELLGYGWTRVGQAGGYRPCSSPKDRWIADAVDLGSVRLSRSTEADPLAGLEVRVRGVSRDVLRHWGAKAWWKGMVSIPLADLPVHR